MDATIEKTIAELGATSLHHWGAGNSRISKMLVITPTKTRCSPDNSW
jgi:hypothetical protein